MQRSLGLLLIVLSSSLALQAQTASAPPRGPDSVTKSFTPGIDVLPYPNLPSPAPIPSSKPAQSRVAAPS